MNYFPGQYGNGIIALKGCQKMHQTNKKQLFFYDFHGYLKLVKWQDIALWWPGRGCNHVPAMTPRAGGKRGGGI